jgi:glyoxylase-like metal-dependent hydrolase (beta-lactamase superfamily II)
MRFLFKTSVFLLIVALVLGGAVLAWGHIQLRRIDPRLPAIDEILEPDRSSELPVRLTWINTASQRMPRSVVLEPDLDPNGDAEYTMSHPSFVVEWQDGRIFLIDLGMDAAGAVPFGMPAEMFAGADPIEPHTATSSRLGGNAKRVAGIGFTHMHADHVGGVTQLCRDIAPVAELVPVFQHHYQMSFVNHTTRAARQELEEADCVERRGIGTHAGLIPVTGFPGLFAIPAGGHTPGSTVYVVQLRTIPGESEGRYDDIETWVITGDIVNHYQGVEAGIPKPRLYSLLLVPENDERLGEVRSFLRELADEPGVKLLVNHDRNQIEATGLPAY